MRWPLRKIRTNGSLGSTRYWSGLPGLRAFLFAVMCENFVETFACERPFLCAQANQNSRWLINFCYFFGFFDIDRSNMIYVRFYCEETI